MEEKEIVFKRKYKKTNYNPIKPLFDKTSPEERSILRHSSVKSNRISSDNDFLLGAFCSDDPIGKELSCHTKRIKKPKH